MNRNILQSDAENTAIKATGLTKSYQVGDVTINALCDIDVSLYKGELTLLMGPSGSGKSTLASMLGGLLLPDSGSITAMGQSLHTLKRKKLDKFRLQYCGFIFQSVNLFQSLTASEQIEYALSHMGIKGKQASARSKQALAEVNLTSRAHLKPRQMSGGENQRVAIARTLAMDPKLIIADEPTSALDSVTGQVVVDLLHKAAKNHGAMVLCVTHDERLKKHADRLLRMEDGHLLSDERFTS